MTQGISELPAFVNRSWSGWRNVTRNTAGERELLEQFLESRFVLSDVRIHLAPGALQVDIADDRGTAVAGPSHIEHVQVIFVDDAIQVCVDEVLPGRRSPVADDERLDV